MRRLALPLILVTHLLALEGCKSFTLVGSVNLGAPSAAAATVDAPEVGPVVKLSPCHDPLPAPVKAEFKAHGYITGHEPDWKATRAYFETEGKLPPCSMRSTP